MYNLNRLRNIYLDTVHGQGNGPERRVYSRNRKEFIDEADIQHTMQMHGLSREEVLERIGG